jgi:hypothetical protein
MLRAGNWRLILRRFPRPVLLAHARKLSAIAALIAERDGSRAEDPQRRGHATSRCRLPLIRPRVAAPRSL